MNRNFINIKLILFALGATSIQKTWSYQRPRIHDEINHGWIYEHGKPTMLFNSLKDRNSNGMSFHRHRSQMTFLPVYYPNYMLRRKRVPLLPSNIYPHRGMLPTNQSDKRYFTFSYIPGSTNMLNKVKWSNYVYPYKNFNSVLKTTPKTSYYILSPEKLKINLQNREPYFTKPISSTNSLVPYELSPEKLKINLQNREPYFTKPISSPNSLLPNYCVNTYKFNANYANLLPICINKQPTMPTPIARIPFSNTKYISTTLRFEPSTRNPYTQHLFSTASLQNSMNTSHIYFTIGDAITPRTIGNTEFKQERTINSKIYDAYSPTEYNIPRSHTMISELWTMASNPINLQQTPPFSQPPNIPATDTFTDDEARNTSQDFNLFTYANLKPTQPHWNLDRFQNNTCSNSLLDTNFKCASENIDITKAFVPTVSLQISTTTTTLKPSPIETTISFRTTSTPLTKPSYLDNASTTVFWNAKHESNNLNEELSSTTSTSTKRPPYRRSKIAHISKRLVFKEKIKEKERVAKTSTVSTPLRTTEWKTKEKRKYISSTSTSSSQTASSTRTTELEPSLRVKHIPKKPKNKFQVKNRSRWTPYEKTYSKANGGNTTTSTTMATLLKLTTSSEPQRSVKSSKPRSKVTRHNRRSHLKQISTTRKVPDLRPQSTTQVAASSTPESAIMRISNMSSGKHSLVKNNTSNSVIPIQRPSNGFVAELPIVTYFKEITESRKI